MSGPPKSNTVPPATAARSYCTSDDTRAVILCIWRHPREHTVHPATARAPNPPLVVVGGTVCPASCRRWHSLSFSLSPEAQFDSCRPSPHASKGSQAAAPALARPDCAADDTRAEPYCASGDSCSFKLCLRRQQRGHTVHPATARASNPPLVVARSTVCLASCRQGHSLAPRLAPITEFGDQRTLGSVIHVAPPYEKERPGADALRPLGPSVRAVRYSATGPAARTSSDISGYFAAALSTNILATRRAVSS